MVFVVLGVVAGVSFAFLRYPVLPLVPVSALLGTAALLTGVALGNHSGMIAVDVLASVAAPQFAFVAVSLTSYIVRSTMLIPQVQAAIGQQLRFEFEVPRGLTPELASLVAQLGDA
jgi:hypothetical protein